MPASLPARPLAVLLVRPLAALLVVLTLAAGRPAEAQPARTVPTDDAAYLYVDRLQRRGLLLELHPTALPYTEGEITAALDALDRQLTGGLSLGEREREWVRMLRRRVPTATAEPGQLTLRGSLGTGLQASSSARMDPLRPLDAPVSIPLGDGALFSTVDTRVTLGAGRAVGQFGLRHNVYANDDPDGLDVALRGMVRNEEAYVAYRSPLADIALGRLATHWGRTGRDALFLSDNPRPFDAVHIRIGGERIAARSILGELDTALPDGSFTDVIGQRPGDRPSALPRINRYFSAHRFDWRPSRYVALTALESAVYSGANAGPSLAYLLPTQAFIAFIDNAPKNTENNGTIGGLLWAYWRTWTLQGQIFVDDFDALNFAEPIGGALAGTLTKADVLPGLDAELALTAVTARAYNTHQPEGTYVYALRGLGVEFNDYVRLGLGADWYAAPGLTLSPGVQALWQGEEAIEGPYPEDEVGTILTGDVDRTLRLALAGRYQTDARWWATADVGLNLADAPTQRGIHGLLTIGARIGAAGAVRADL